MAKMLLGFAALLQYASAFYVPGVAPIDFAQEDKVEIKAVKMTSSKTQLPYEYYSLPLCKPENVRIAFKNLGEVLRGDRIVNTNYDVRVGVDQECTILCTQSITTDEREAFVKKINEAYTVHLLADNLPIATKWKLEDDVTQYEHGYKLGIIDGEDVFINNHLELNIKYNKEYDDVLGEQYRVVAFEVSPKSVATTNPGDDQSCSIDINDKHMKIDGSTAQITFSYSVHWEESQIRWASRWDTYLEMGDVQIHWFSIVNSIVVVFFLAGILAMIIVRTLRRDIAQYNKEDDELDEAMEETGWKLVHGDVFRPPQYSSILCAFIGSGVQIGLMAMITIIVAMFGMLSPSARGSLVTAGFFLFMFMGIFSGYSSGRLYKTVRGQSWKSAAIWTGLLYPSITFGTCFLLNFFIWGQKSSGAVPFTTMIAILCMWFGVSLPLVMTGFYFGFRKAAYEAPVRTNQIPRQVPDQPWYMNAFVSLLMSGVLPFGAVFIELFFIFTALWENEFYYLFGFLFLVFIILIIACSQIAIVMVYFQLCAEDYHWWWRSFFVGSGSAFYVFLYSIFYFYTKLEITSFVPTLLYFGYTALITLTFAIFTGTISFYASFVFINKIYGQIKID
ncbi:unnamed protein product [Oikopleura dioica]|uniref:Transmembrane 9 superfamily member n=1 Tax=Oikopleura dioica TaxID=34765 RepID=E4XHS4_OIKDI|nr:unnamed protein product [Oikopleura dioica]